MVYVISAERPGYTLPLAGSIWLAGIEVQNFPIRVKQRILELAAPLRIRLNSRHGMTRLDDGAVVENVKGGIIENATHFVGVQATKMALQIVQADFIKSTRIHDHLAVGVRDFEEPDIQ